MKIWGKTTSRAASALFVAPHVNCIGGASQERGNQGGHRAIFSCFTEKCRVFSEWLISGYRLIV